jgi:hypothetical protein
MAGRRGALVAARGGVVAKGGVVALVVDPVAVARARVRVRLGRLGNLHLAGGER